MLCKGSLAAEDRNNYDRLVDGLQRKKNQKAIEEGFAEMVKKPLTARVKTGLEEGMKTLATLLKGIFDNTKTSTFKNPQVPQE